MRSTIRRGGGILRRKLAARSREYISRSCDFEPTGNLLLFGDPRGGTTWLTELLKEVPGTAVLWEPMHTRYVPRYDRLGFTCRTPEYQRCCYLPEDAESEIARACLEQMLTGKFLNEWTCFMSSAREIKNADRLLIKFCYGTAMLPWLTRNFQFQYLPVHIVRHPFAVVASQLNHPHWIYGAPDVSPLNFTGFEFDCEGHQLYGDHAQYLSGLKSKHELLTATWCISNLIPLQSDRNGADWITIYYEEIITEPERVFEDIFASWGMPIPETIWSRLRVPSVSTQDTNFRARPETQLSKWRDQLSQEQLREMAAVLNYFEIDLYGSDIYPRRG